MTPEELHKKLQLRVNTLMSEQRKERHRLRQDEKNYAADSDWNQNYYFSFEDAWDQECMRQIADIDNLETKNGRLMRKFVEMKIQRKAQNNRSL